MAMINCPECGKEISDKAASCPNCGCPIGVVSTADRGDDTPYIKVGNSPYQSNNPYQSSNPYQAQQSTPREIPYQPAQKNSGLGITALVLSILGCTFWLGAILAIVDLCKKDNHKKNCSIIALCVCGFWLIVGIAVNYVDDSSEKTTVSSTTVESDHTPAVEESVTEIPEESVVEETQIGEEAEIESEEGDEGTSNIFYVGDILETKRVKLSYLSCGEYTDDNMFVEAGAGNKFVYFEFEFENIGDVDVSVGSFDFDCYADGYDAKSTMSTADNAMISITTLSPGRKTNGIVVFEVPQSAGTIEVEYETSYWTQDKAIFIYE